MDYTVHGILQAGILEWVTIPFSRGSFQPRDRTQVSCIAGGFFTSQSLGKPKRTWSLCFFSLETLTFGSHSPSCKKPDFSAAEPMWRARVERPRGEKTWDWGEVRERERKSHSTASAIPGTSPDDSRQSSGPRSMTVCLADRSYDKKERNF